MELLNDPVVKGDTLKLECTLNICDVIDITNWKIRVELYDQCGNFLRLATVNTGGTVGDIVITNPAGTFILTFAKGLTKNFADEAFLEVELETDDVPSELFTVNPGEKSKITFCDQKIEWTTP